MALCIYRNCYNEVSGVAGEHFCTEHAPQELSKDDPRWWKVPLSEAPMTPSPTPEARALVEHLDEVSELYRRNLALAIDAHTAAAVLAEREACALVAWNHRGAAERDRRAKGRRSSEYIMAEERGETIAAEIITEAIRARTPSAGRGTR